MVFQKNPISSRKIIKIKDGREPVQLEDSLTGEEPLAIVLRYFKNNRLVDFPLAITMRTPGSDEALVMGFLLTEGIVDSMDRIKTIELGSHSNNPLLRDQTITVTFQPDFIFDESSFSRNFSASSSCGVCGKSSVSQLENHILSVLPKSKPRVTVKTLLQLNDTMRPHQELFSKTGSIHATAVFSPDGVLQLIEEDVGRHNAMDKAIGKMMKLDTLPFNRHLVSVSGRAGFELVQKALIAGFPIITAVGAPSDLAADLADAYGMTLIGFLKGKQFNIYTHSDRIIF